jgi:hypothetical protein
VRALFVQALQALPRKVACVFTPCLALSLASPFAFVLTCCNCAIVLLRKHFVDWKQWTLFQACTMRGSLNDALSVLHHRAHRSRPPLFKRFFKHALRGLLRSVMSCLLLRLQLIRRLRYVA